MTSLKGALVGAAILCAIISSAVTPAFALGGCGPNGHRNAWGQCVWGGQNQAWCIRNTGHPAVRMPDGTMVCVR